MALTLKAVKAELAKVGISVYRVDGEYKVYPTFKGEQAYFTSSLTDARGTGLAMALAIADEKRKKPQTDAPSILTVTRGTETLKVTPEPRQLITDAIAIGLGEMVPFLDPDVRRKLTRHIASSVCNALYID